MALPDYEPQLRPIQDKLHELLVSSSGYAEDQVLVADQNAPPAVGDYLTFRLVNGPTVGGARGERITEDLNADPGQEIILSSQGSQELVLYLQAFTRATNEGEEAPSAEAVLKCVQQQLRLSLNRAALSDLGVSIFDFGTPQDVPRPFGSRMEGRASLDLRLYVNEGASWRTGYIASCTPTGTLAGVVNPDAPSGPGGPGGPDSTPP